MPNHLAFVTYETPFAPCGGIAAVMGRLPEYIQTALGQHTIVITPFHHRIDKTSSLKMERIGNVSVPFDDTEILVNIQKYEDKWPWYFLLPEAPLEPEKPFFDGKRHPYDVSQPQLVRDALFFGVAVARTLQIIGPDDHWTLMLQDWETATTALASVSQGSDYKLFLTLHNSYDSGAVYENELRRVGIDPWKCFGDSPGATILQRALRLMEWPVFTVSDQFASDFTEDPFQFEVMAPHLRQLQPRLLGVNNGLFRDLEIEEHALADAAHGNFKPLLQWKAQKRREFLDAINNLKEELPDRPVWGDLSQFKDDSAWFIFAGRDDPRQKGYDVAVSAIRKFLQQGGNARFLFFPIPGDEGLEGLTFLKTLTGEFPGKVVAFPFRFAEGFSGALRGAAYGVMPSLYEPFGMANEFYLNGTVGIGRATGGIIQQIVPLQSASSFSRSVQDRAKRWHSVSAHPTGILYRERDGIPSAIDDWRGINEAHYDIHGGSPDRVNQREQYLLFQTMVNELRISFTDGIRVYQGNPELYYRMLTEGIAYVQRSFSWERASQEYVRNLI
ncbi:glycogen/starch synthase [Candidatus Poribacteria bacterium]|nr:glycogen/starch synthase [Candidatus Poribacteria bacterium]